MLGFIVHAIVNPFARLWLATSSRSWRQLPRPDDRPLVHAPGPDADRILLIGSGIAVGYGVVSHDLALGGHLARELSSTTGRGVSVEIIASPDVAPPMVGTTLATLDLKRFDALIFALGGLEVFTLMPEALWRAQIRDLLSTLDRLAPAQLEVFFIETSIPLVASLPRFYRNLVIRRARLLNDRLRELAAVRKHTTFVEFFPGQGDITSLKGRATYHDWAKTIAPAIAVTLEPAGRGGRHEDIDEQLRLAALADLDISSVPSEGIEQIVAIARRLFDTSGARVTIIESDRQMVMAGDGIADESLPRDDAVCNITIRRAELFVIEDALTDIRIVGTSLASGKRFRFYAGYPLEAPDGHRIGALCITDHKPRSFSAQDAALLRDLALRVQALLWVNVA